MSAGLHVHELARRFGPRWVVGGVSFDVDFGRGLLLTGPNGSGKTTLMRVLSTALKPHHGTATLDGRPLWEERSELRHQVAFVSHHSRLYEDLSAAQNLVAWARMHGSEPDTAALLAKVGLPTDRGEPVRTFSAGMKKRLSLALALLKQPRLLLLDEPFSALDPPGRQQMAALIAELVEAGAALVLATHMVEEASALCHTAVHLEQGKVVWAGDARQAREVW